MRVLFLLCVILVAGCSNSNTCGEGELKIADLTIGTGTAAAEGDLLSLNFIGQDGQGVIFDQTAGTGPVQLYLTPGNAENVFGSPGAGLYQGLLGMKADGSRRLTVPPNQAYGTSYPSECQNITYTIDLISVSAQ